MMAAARAVRGEATLERELRGKPGAADDMRRTVRHGFAHRKADSSFLVARHARRQHLIDIVGVVRRLDPGARRRRGFMPVDRRAAGKQQITDQAVLVPSIGTARRRLGYIAWMMDDSDHAPYLGTDNGWRHRPMREDRP
jgi:hypothetical protein